MFPVRRTRTFPSPIAQAPLASARSCNVAPCIVRQRGRQRCVYKTDTAREKGHSLPPTSRKDIFRTQVCRCEIKQKGPGFAAQ
ncbi:hypothetical protein NDU88_000484 [Pleurodeles waltl]|uniref:Uncharacterized protein n=1 Tax=Pleurodeles waltl TaxID=8319 RepID=A0AAV7LAD2_PLEWA|nr:hypothetical protein NDU88_000484 [Pleurodeles waltl]